jgi:hypothetical protein
MPETPLTKILHEFRAYRPLPHREFLTYIREKSEEIGVQKYAVSDSETAVLFLRTLNHIRSFRWRHWLFAREYIIRRTPHPTATGGSPIVTVSQYINSANLELKTLMNICSGCPTSSQLSWSLWLRSMTSISRPKKVPLLEATKTSLPRTGNRLSL